MSEVIKIGVWIEKGKVLSRSNEKQIYPKVFIPKDEVNLLKVKSIARQLHDGNTMSHWTAETEVEQNRLTQQLTEIASTE
jgi:hypothetical protein